MSFHTSRQQPSNGSATGAQRSPRLILSLDRALMERIVGEAARRKVPMAAVVRERLLQAYRDTEAAD